MSRVKLVKQEMSAAAAMPPIRPMPRLKFHTKPAFAVFNPDARQAEELRKALDQRFDAGETRSIVRNIQNGSTYK